ncbi:hypothetical protein GCM10008018_46290 [Paenibacillus marchantiophytorum]|uniref:Uncharacterized protein n=1 Tax=Paenibacillus marchantiophytorum TaxID=1619310 RepID=A0ABQ1EZJ2_9BACL|nr:hypothetical protein [Paenibacillus marchantiophytorum]GFZ94666.1 hypothetical protein GCM10008018_46290 [Paenibacillus marchantiophytorum]
MRGEKIRIRKSLEVIEWQIENIVNAVAAGASNPTFLEKLSLLEQQKLDLSQKLMEAESVKEKAAITEESLQQLLSQFGAHLANRELPEIKKFIASYAEKVIVYEKNVEVIFKVPVVVLINGGEGSRTIVPHFTLFVTKSRKAPLCKALSKFNLLFHITCSYYVLLDFIALVYACLRTWTGIRAKSSICYRLFILVSTISRSKLQLVDDTFRVFMTYKQSLC